MIGPIAFLGMGVMGAPMAANLARAGFEVRVWNRTADAPGVAVAREAGANVAACISEAVEGAAVILSCVSDAPDVEELLCRADGVVDYAAEGALVIDFSTIGPDAARETADALADAKLRFLDAPVSGGDVGAKAGTLTIMVGGRDEDLDEARPVLEVLGKNIHHCGEVGSGQAVKLCNQVLCAVGMVAVSEAIELARAQDIDPRLVVDVCKSGAAGSWALENLGPRAIDEDFAPGFMIKHLLKDLRLVNDANEAGDGADLEGVDLAFELLDDVASMDNEAGANLGTQALVRAYRER